MRERKGKRERGNWMAGRGMDLEAVFQVFLLVQNK
jgi:hypothetical protein